MCFKSPRSAVIGLLLATLGPRPICCNPSLRACSFTRETTKRGQKGLWLEQGTATRGRLLTACGPSVAIWGLRVASCSIRVANCGPRAATYGPYMAACGPRVAACGLCIAAQTTGFSRFFVSGKGK